MVEGIKLNVLAHSSSATNSPETWSAGLQEIITALLTQGHTINSGSYNYNALIVTDNSTITIQKQEALHTRRLQLRATTKAGWMDMEMERYS